ncbi:MAG: hypothetical protein WCD66_05200 [Rhodanobacteraceae bacterium]
MSFVCRLCAFALLALLAVAPAGAQVIFGARVNGSGGPVTGLFQVSNGTVTPINTGLISNDFASLSPNGAMLTISSADPAQPNEASTDLFAYNRTTGQTRRLFNNSTQTLPDGSHLFASPMFSGTSADGTLVAFVNLLASSSNNQGGGGIRQLKVLRASDGFDLGDAELGHGNQTDYFESEFNGIAWTRSGHAFVTPAYVPVVTNSGRNTIAAGLVLFAQQANGSFARSSVLTVPQVFDNPGGGIVVQTHAMPAISPDGQRIAFFRLTWPNPLLTQPVTPELIVINPSQGTGSVLAQFNSGVYPLGVAWSADGNTLVFSLANQVFQGGTYLPAGDPNSAGLLTIPSQGGTLGSVAGAPSGYFPNVVTSVPGLIFRNGFE